MTEYPSTLVHTKSSTIHSNIKPTYRATLLQSCEADLQAAEEIYAYFDEIDATEKLWRLKSCRTGAFFFRNKNTGAVRVGAQSCHLRHCPICTKTRELTIKTNVASWLRKTGYPKLLTFTLKHHDRPLIEQINTLYESFKKIRRLSILKNRCSGGVWFFQVKKSKKDHLWHPHIHCLVAGQYIPQRDLAKAWLKITGDSNIVDIRLVKSVEHVAKDVARYAAKPCKLSTLEWSDILEVAVALDKRRLCGTWGICRKLKITSLPDFEKGDWYQVGSWNGVYENRNVDDNAKAIMDCWRTGKPLETGINIDHLYGDELFETEVSERGSPTIEYQTFFEWKGK